MPNYKHDLTGALLAWPAAEDHIFHLYELDPTHTAAQAFASRSSALRQSNQQTRVMSSLRLLDDHVYPAVLLELDPTHLHGR